MQQHIRIDKENIMNLTSVPQAIIPIQIGTVAEGFIGKNSAWKYQSVEYGVPWSKYPFDFSVFKQEGETSAPYKPGDIVRCRVERGKEKTSSNYDPKTSLLAYWVNVTSMGIEADIFPQDPQHVTRYLMSDITGEESVSASSAPRPPVVDDNFYNQVEEVEELFDELPAVERVFDPQVNWESIKDFEIDKQKIFIRQSALDKAVPLITNMMIGDPEPWSTEKTLNHVNMVIDELALMIWGQYVPKSEEE